ncbi:5-oxoprolinase subunit PxpA [Lentibacillus sp.]|uniref:LamB/YcsF family protein n=1 Tax=Lentibacillus sp. TaxID=1925746 RepID=UPI002B4B5733|nr:5-oxoprolinase subunit PxpA [Lentibacillus sp.]HLS10476.1 5-oxoprolinase subunit PxpA [Lentibacillus sp.]
MNIDINCDMGESFGVYNMGRDEEILDYITSANIACGFHAGDQSTMRKTVKMALEKDVGIGAHPGFPDLNGFGRRYIALSPEEIYELVIYQVGALQGFVKAEGGRMQHVKAHGALYNHAAKDKSIAESIAKAVYDLDPELILFGLAGGELVEAGEQVGLPTASEVFADRTYQEDGSLTSRREKDALILDQEVASSQVVQMAKNGKVRSQQGTDISIKADTVCIHGDGIHALEFAQQINQGLADEYISVSKIGEFL